MKILVAGATGALGKQLVPRLVAGGHDVAGMTRSDSKVEAVRSLGASPVVADALEPEQVARAVAEVEPEVIVHQLTALAGSLTDVRHPDRAFALTDRLRTEGTDHLLAAGRAVGVRRFVAQSYAGWRFARRGGPVMTEEDPLDLGLPDKLREMLVAIRHLEDAVTGAGWTEGLVLRYGNFYGPGTSMAPDGEHFETIRNRKFPLVGSGAGVWSFVHIEDAAEATVAAVERGNRGIYNIVDDEPAAVAEWLPALAQRLGCQTSATGPPVAGAVACWRGRCCHADRGPGGIEHKGEARVGLAPESSELA